MRLDSQSQTQATMTLHALTQSSGNLGHEKTEYSTARRLILRDGRFLACSEYGAPIGFPLFYLHDAGSSRLEAGFFDAEARRKGFRLIAVDRPGIGESGALPGFTRLSCSDDILQVADALGIERFGILSAGSGSAIALVTAASAPRRVAMVLGLSSQFPLSNSQAGFLSALARASFELCLQAGVGLRLWLRGTSPKRYVQRLRDSLTYADRRLLDNPDIREHLIRVAEEAVRSGGAGIARDAILAMAPLQLATHKLHMPVHLWQGSTESSALQNQQHQFAESLPAATVHRLNNRGRFFFWRHTEEVFAVAQSVLGVGKQGFVVSGGRQVRLPEPDTARSVAMAG